MDTRLSFIAGYESVKHHKITRELTNAEIEENYPKYVIAAFEQGMIDAFAGDSWRYKRAKIKIDGSYTTRKKEETT